MKNEQLNLYGSPDKFEVRGKTPEDLEREASEDILKNKISAFIDEQESKKKLRKNARMGSLEIHNLAVEFAGGAESENLPKIKKILATNLLRREYDLSEAVIRVEIGDENLNLMKTKKEIELKPDKRALREKRATLSYSHRSMPDSDLD
jgi:hypothetical protein